MDVPEHVVQYLANVGGFERARLEHEHPDLPQQLASAEMREKLLEWLAGAEAQEPTAAGLVANTLDTLRPHAEPPEATTVRPYTLHDEPHVRLRAYEYLLTLYFPHRNREALMLVLQSMLSDPDDGVRRLGARYVDRADAGTELHAFLTLWVAQAADRGWDTGQAYELVTKELAERGEA